MYIDGIKTKGDKYCIIGFNKLIIKALFVFLTVPVTHKNYHCFNGTVKKSEQNMNAIYIISE